jgi:pimeloyl-ACP methyl ester carboxylesterase
VFAGAGFVFVAPDYPGFGDSTVPRHRYFDAQAEARSAVDLLTASQRVLHRLRVKQSAELFTFGFSQGGHAALALHRLLERRHVDVTATASVGGVYDVEHWFLAMPEDETTVTLPLYVSYLLLAYDDIYDVYGEPSEVFREQYAQTVPGLFDMQQYWDDVLAGLPPTSRELLPQSYFDAVRGNPVDPMRVRLRQNAVDRWGPDAPIRIYHSPTDEEVFYEDALVSIDRLRHRGGDVTLEEVSGDLVRRRTVRPDTRESPGWRQRLSPG